MHPLKIEHLDTAHNRSDPLEGREALLALNLERDAAAAAEMKEISNNEHV